jgi:peptide/nickel transport system substrate-binding protein
MLMGTAPQSLDPGLDYTTEGGEVNWLVYTGLTTYRHASRSAGTQLIPGLATSLPAISDGGRTYTATLRRGLVFSNGQPVVASDFTYTVERALKIPWGGSAEFITPVIVGASAYARGKARTISGITTDNATGRIVIHLTAPYGPFDNVLAFPALGLIPAGTPFTPQPTSPGRHPVEQVPEARKRQVGVLLRRRGGEHPGARGVGYNREFTESGQLRRKQACARRGSGMVGRRSPRQNPRFA